MRIVLASTSPRRRELFALLGVPFDVGVPDYEERPVPGQPAEAMVAQFAKGKAYSLAKEDPDAVVLGSDTLIELDGEVMGKPKDLQEARIMLQRMAGREHVVHTAVTLVCLARRIEVTECRSARVRMRPFDAAVLERYLATGDSLGKAGAYSIQGPGCELIESIQGDYLTVVGFPIRLVATLLKEVGVTPPVDVQQLYQTKPYGTWERFSSDPPSK